MNRLATRGMNLTQQVAETLGSAIIGQVYGDHNPVPSEAIICEELNVSRSAAREAVKSLAAKGLITSRARQGIRVLPESEWNLFDADVLRWMRDANPSLGLLREFTELRVAIEPEAAYLAAKRQNKTFIAEIASALERMSKAEQGLDDPLESDIAFHLSVLNASENRFFMQLGRIIDTTLRVSIRFTNRRTGVRAGSYNDHKKIFDEIVAGNPLEAAKYASELMQGTLTTILDALDEGIK
ncbi:MAG: FadR family transcriptional regulator [Gammaproteobacteria bacterium]|nr:FadR family transcriptional regulator [Gammaproteobacteria bacterium]